MQNSTVPLANQAAILSKERAREFMSYFPDIVGAVMERVKKNSNQEIGNHVVRVREIHRKCESIHCTKINFFAGSSVQCSGWQKVSWNDCSASLRDNRPQGSIDGGELETRLFAGLVGRIRKYFYINN